MEQLSIQNTPRAEDLWKGIGGHFDSFGQILCEFIDNSVSNFKASHLISKTISITLTEEESGVLVEIEDSGTGIKNLNAAFSLGNRDAAESTLNEHGFGMKHALASCDPANSSWIICTRSVEDFKQGRFHRITAPYVIGFQPAETLTKTDDDGVWPGILNGSGTYVSFRASTDLFRTIRKGITEKSAGLKGNFTQFVTYIEILREDLGFVYAGIILSNLATITLVAKPLDAEDALPMTVEAVVPNWESFYKPSNGEITKNLGEGEVKLRYAFGAIKESEYRRYYKRNQSSSGLEIRLNGRVIANNLFEKVWNLAPHNDYNHLLVLVDIISSNRIALPSTRTSKNGLREGDRRYESIVEWVREMMPNPPKEIEEGTDEASLFEELEKMKLAQIPDPKYVSLEEKVFKAVKEKVRIDLYVKHGDEVVIYEGKKNKTTFKDVYQLRMYWDGCTLDGIQPTKAVLISAEHPSSVRLLVDYCNQMLDLNGNLYNIVIKTWKDEAIDFPK